MPSERAANHSHERDLSRATMRRELRQLRREIPQAQRSVADQAICAQIRRHGVFRSARHIAGYFAFDGEPDVSAVLALALTQGKYIYAPVIDRTAMSFAALSGAHALQRNFFGILEPAASVYLDPRALDLVLTPLVGFDSSGTRLGVGKGYYDRCFRFLRARRHWQRPKLLGVAYGDQQVDALARQAWDVPLWGAVTERFLTVF